MKKILIIFVFLGQILVAQDITVQRTEEILNSDDVGYYFPHLSPDGDKFLFTDLNFSGLHLFDFITKEVIKLSDKQGSGFKPVFSDDGSIVFFRENEYEGFRKVSKICSVNLNTGEKAIIESKKRNVSTPQIINNQLFYTVDGKSSEVSDNTTAVFIERQKIVLYSKGIRKAFTPKGDGNYIWASLSPDEKKILFTFAGHGTYISDLGYLNAPKWYSNNHIVGMKDYDDGSRQTASDIYLVSADGSETIQLTETGNIIEMYPDCSVKSSKIVYHTNTGNIYCILLTK